MRKTVCLIGCCKGKAKLPCAAKDLYRSPLFRLCRRWAEANADAWFVLSAKLGCVRPEQTIEPYDRTVRERRPFNQAHPLRPADYATWMYASVQAQICQYATPGQAPRLIVLAGKDYWQLLAGRYEMELPLDGMGVGERLRWLKERTEPSLFDDAEVLS